MRSGAVVALALVGKDACEEDWIESKIIERLLHNHCIKPSFVTSDQAKPHPLITDLCNIFI